MLFKLLLYYYFCKIYFHFSVFNYFFKVTSPFFGVTATGAFAPNAADPDFSVGIAVGGVSGSTSQGGSGGNGRVVVFGC